MIAPAYYPMLLTKGRHTVMVKHLLIGNTRYQDESESLVFGSFATSSSSEKIKL